MHSANPYVAWAKLTYRCSDAPESIFMMFMMYFIPIENLTSFKIEWFIYKFLIFYLF